MAATTHLHILPTIQCPIYKTPSNESEIIGSINDICKVDYEMHGEFYKLTTEGYIKQSNHLITISDIPKIFAVKCICTGLYQGCNIRSSPFIEAEKLGVMRKGDVVRIYDVVIGGFYKLFGRSGFIGIELKDNNGTIEWDKISPIIEDYEHYKISGLRELCKRFNILFTPRMTRKELIGLLDNFHKTE